jgi:formylmethanofuran dehydrogenase subunit B
MSTVLEHVACPFCGCLCDDITVEVEDERILKVKRACTSGQGIFMDYDPRPRRPRSTGARSSSTRPSPRRRRSSGQGRQPARLRPQLELERGAAQGVELADRVGAFIDSTSSVCHGPTGIAMQAVGEPTCTLGEVRDRADLIVFWGCNPDASHLRHFGRFSLTAKGALTAKGREDRTMYVIDVRPTGTTKKADHFLQVEQGRDFEVLTALRLLVKGEEPRATRSAASPSLSCASSPSVSRRPATASSSWAWVSP